MVQQQILYRRNVVQYQRLSSHSCRESHSLFRILSLLKMFSFCVESWAASRNDDYETMTLSFWVCREEVVAVEEEKKLILLNLAEQHNLF